RPTLRREPRRPDASRAAHPDDRALPGPAVRKVDPHPGLAALPPRGDSVGRERVGERELDRANVANEVIVFAETGDRISDELPGSVIGDIAATIDPVDRRARGVKHVGANEKMVGSPAAPDGVDGRMLEEQKPLRVARANARRDRLLEPPGVEVRDPP